MASNLPNYEKMQDSIARAYKEATTSSVFGYGYAQVAPDGIDNIQYSTSIKLIKLTLSQLISTIDFLDSLGGSLPFLVPILGEPDMVVTSAGYSKDTIDSDTFNLTIALQEHKFPGVTP